MNYISLLEVLGLPAGTIFTPTADPNYYTSATDEDVIIATSTLVAKSTYFEQAPEFEYSDKLAGLEILEVDSETWTPAVGDYFTTYKNELDCWKIVADDDPNWQVVKLTGNFSGEIPDLIAKATITDDHFRVFWPAEGSGSSSASGSGS